MTEALNSSGFSCGFESLSQPVDTPQHNPIAANPIEWDVNSTLH